MWLYFLVLVMNQAAAFCTLWSQGWPEMLYSRQFPLSRRDANFCGFSVKKISNSSNIVEMEICHTISGL